MKLPPNPYALNTVMTPVAGTGMARSAPPVYRPQMAHPQMANLHMNQMANNFSVKTTGIAPSLLQRKPFFASAVIIRQGPKPYSVVQSKVGAISGQPKYYPNLNPAAALKVDPSEFMRLEGTFDQSHFRMRRGGDHGLLVPNTKFIFVRTMEGSVVMHQRYRHPVLAQGKPVLYAGEAYFNNGKLDWWSNGSGNYRPDPDHAQQAHLPMEKFFTYEQVLKGANKQA